MSRKIPLDLAADKFLRSPIRRGDRLLIRFQIMLNAFVVITKCDAPGTIGKLFCEVEVGLEVIHSVNYNRLK